jgi:hypothetical protein
MGGAEMSKRHKRMAMNLALNSLPPNPRYRTMAGHESTRALYNFCYWLQRVYNGDTMHTNPPLFHAANMLSNAIADARQSYLHNGYSVQTCAKQSYMDVRGYDLPPVYTPPNSYQCPTCGSRDMRFIEKDFFEGASGWYRKYRCGQCGEEYSAHWYLVAV